jgi:hypothetical protein
LAVAIIARLARTRVFSVKPVALSGAISELSGAGGTFIWGFGFVRDGISVVGTTLHILSTC